MHDRFGERGAQPSKSSAARRGSVRTPHLATPSLSWSQMLPVLLVVMVGAVAGCAQAGGGSGADPSPPPPRSVPATTAPATTVSGDPASCPVEELQPAVERDIPMAEGLELAEVRLTHCRNNHARVILVAAMTPDHPAGSTDDLPAYLEHTSSGWQVVAYGGHIDCAHPAGLSLEEASACRALDQ